MTKTNCLQDYLQEMSQCPTPPPTPTPTPQYPMSDGSLEEDRESSGWELSRMLPLHHSFRTDARGSPVNSNVERADTSTGSWWSPSPTRNLLPKLQASSDPSTSNSPIPMERMPIARRQRLPFLARNLNLGASLYSGTPRKTGTTSGQELNLGTLMEFPQVFVYKVIVRSGLSARTLADRLLSSVQSMSSGVQLEQERVDEPGMRPVWMLTLKIQEPSSGVVIEIRSMLSSMNLEETSTSHTCCVGSIVIRSLWKSKAALRSLKRRRSGSPRILTPESGTQR